MEMLPSELGILFTGDSAVSHLTPVKSLSVFVSSSQDFHPEGLFSNEVFGMVGTPERLSTFSYIRTKLPVIHPYVYKLLTRTRSLYLDIMRGNKYAKFDESSGDFVESDAMSGRTGYSFFITHFDKLQLTKNGSDRRDGLVDLMEKEKGNLTFKNLLVWPAGYRDYIIDDDGKPSKDEVNDYYLQALGKTNLIPDGAKNNDMSVDQTRFSLQQSVQDIFDYFQTLWDGKTKAFQGKFLKRRIYHGTRNVLTPNFDDSVDIEDHTTIDQSEVMAGLHQTINAIAPITKHEVKSGFLSEVFPSQTSDMRLIDKKTLRSKYVPIDIDLHDRWMTSTGINSELNRFAIEENRSEPMQYKGYYLGLLYRDNDSYLLLHDIDDLPEGLSKDNVKPLTYVEFFYLSICYRMKDVAAIVTRYPTIIEGGTYPAFIHLKPTVKTESLNELDRHGNKTGKVAIRMPVVGTEYINGMSPHLSNLVRLGGDHDGDLGSLNSVMTKEGVEGIKKLLRSAVFFVGLDGELIYQLGNDIAELSVSHLMTDMESYDGS